MCITCGCGPEQHHLGHDGGHHQHDHDHGHDHPPVGGTKISIETDILARNNRLAAGNRALFSAKGVFVLNLVSSPGSGKTTLLEKTLRALSPSIPAAVIEGDQQTDN